MPDHVGYRVITYDRRAAHTETDPVMRTPREKTERHSRVHE
jgi:hypothetical protein